MDADIPAYFGINVPQIGQDEHRDQVFPRADFPRVAVALQAAQARGNGVVVTTQHVTPQCNPSQPTTTHHNPSQPKPPTIQPLQEMRFPLLITQKKKIAFLIY